MYESLKVQSLSVVTLWVSRWLLSKKPEHATVDDVKSRTIKDANCNTLQGRREEVDFAASSFAVCAAGALIVVPEVSVNLGVSTLSQQ